MIPYVISTWEQMCRMDLFSKRWNESGLIEWVPIVDNEYTDSAPPSYRGSTQSYGCKQAHVRALQIAAETSDHALILEDDAIITRDAWETIVEIEASVKFDVMLLGSMNRIPAKLKENGNVNGHPFMRISHAMGTHAMLIHHDTISDTLLYAMSANCDLGNYYSIHLYPKVFTLAMSPSIIKQDTSLPSSIPDSYNKNTVAW